MPAQDILWICALPGLIGCSLGVVDSPSQDSTTFDEEDDWGGATTTDSTTTDDPTGDSGWGGDTSGEDGGETTDTTSDGTGDSSEEESGGEDSWGGDSSGGDSSGEDSGGDDSGGEDSTGDPSPTLVDTVPTEGAEGVARDTKISLSFDQPMKSDSIVTNAGSTDCVGTVQLTNSASATCHPLDIQIDELDGGNRFELTPTEPLESLERYSILVTTGVRNTDDVGLETDYTTDPFVVRYAHTIAIDGTNDFVSSQEALAASSPGITGYVAWDETYVYLGLSAPDVASNDPALFWFAYLGGPSGTTSGVQYQGQMPELPFAAQWHPRWKSDSTYSNMQHYLEAWEDADGTWLKNGEIAQTDTFVEMRLPRTDLGDPASLPLVMGLLRETIGDEATYGVVPVAAAMDGFDPDLEAYVDLQLDGSVPPSEHPVL